MTAAPRVTVCLPVRNGAPWISGAIESVLSQTLEDWELVITDNCSNDGTAERVQAYPDARIRYLRNSHDIGMYGNTNKCASLARAPFIKFVFADDALTPRALELMTTTLAGEPTADLVIGGTTYVDLDSGDVIRRISWFPECRRFNSRDAVAWLLTNGNGGASPPSVLVRRDALRAVGYFPTEPKTGWGNDWLTWMRVADRSGIIWLPDPVVRIGRHQRSGTARIYARHADIEADLATVALAIEELQPSQRVAWYARSRLERRAVRRCFQLLRGGDWASAVRIAKTVHSPPAILRAALEPILRVITIQRLKVLH